MPKQGITQATYDPLLVKINSLPFFADNFKYNIDNNMEMVGAFGTGSKTVVTDQSIYGTIELGGHFIAEEIQPLIRGDYGTPKQCNISIKKLESGEKIAFEKAMCSNGDEIRANLPRIGEPIHLDFIAANVEHSKPV